MTATSLRRASVGEQSQLAVEIRGLSKSFGRTKALDGLDLTVAPGDITGFLGPNGAGKSTTIRVLLGLLRADGGNAQLLGGDPWRDAVALHRRIAYVPGDVTLWPNLTGLQAIDFLARLRGNGVDTRRRDQLIERFELDPHKKARTYSKGNRQKVAIVAAFSTNAELYILDEPTSGLDPLMEKAFQLCVEEVAGRGAAVLLSSHILAEVEKLCDNVTIIRAGRAVKSGTLDGAAPPDAHDRHSAHPHRRPDAATHPVRARFLDPRRPLHLLGRPQRSGPRDGPAHRSGHHRPHRDACVARGHVPARVPRGDAMSTTAVAPHTGRHEAAPGGSLWTGTLRLLRLALRRDRVRLSVWIAVLTLMMVYAPNAIKLAYPEEAQRWARVNLLKTPAGMMLGGPMFGGNETDLGAMMANELMLTLIVATSILSILTVIRHTRAEEESGAAELVLSSVVGRYARTYAALILVGGVNAILAVTMTLAMAATGFDIVDTAAMCLGVTGVAMVFGAVAAVTAQLWRQARTATAPRWRCWRWPPWFAASAT